MSPALFRLGNRLYRWFPRLYEPLYFGYKEISDRKEREFFRSRVRPGMTVVDVGANIGANTRLFSRLVSPTGRVIAFEPERENLVRLRRLTGALGNVEIVPAAVSDATGELVLHVSDELNVDHHTYDAGDGRRRETVRAVRLDDHFGPGSRVDVIKMDIQGAEYGALRGAERLLRDNVDICVVLEFWPYGLLRAGRQPSDLLEFLRGLGFSVRPFGDAAPEEMAVSERDYMNLVALRSAAVG